MPGSNNSQRKHRFSFSLSPTSSNKPNPNISPPFLSYRQPDTTLLNRKTENNTPLCDRFISNRSTSNLRYGLSSPNISTTSTSSLATETSYPPITDFLTSRTPLSPSSPVDNSAPDNIVIRTNHSQLTRPRSAPLVNNPTLTSSPETSLRRRRSHSLNSSSSTTIVDSTITNNTVSYHQHRSHTTPSRTLSRAGSGYSSPRGTTSNNSTQLSIGSLSDSGRSSSLNNSSNSLSSINSILMDGSFDEAIFNSNGLSSNEYEFGLRSSNHSNDNLTSIDEFLTLNYSQSTLFEDQENTPTDDTIPPSRVPNSFNLDGVLVGGKGDTFDQLLMTELLPNSQQIQNESLIPFSESSIPLSFNYRRSRSVNSSPSKRSHTNSTSNSNILNFSPNDKTSNSLTISRRQTYNSNKGNPEPAFSMLIHPNNTTLTKKGINLKTNKKLVLPKSERVIPEKPIRVLDAPGLRNDFYLNLLDWGDSNLLAVVLNTNIFLWNADNYSVSSLLSTTEANPIASVSWMKTDPYILATGNEEGFVSIYDVQKEKKIRDVHKHHDRVGRLVWNGYSLTSGSRDNQIFISDIRVKNSIIQLSGHSQEICGLKWNNTGKQLASGGNDNNLLVWEPQHNSRYPIWKFSDGHNSAIKALSWSPYDSNILVSGGGVMDRCLRFWDTSTGQVLSTKKTSSQICNIHWSKFTNEIITTHGLMSQNHITIWSSYPELNPISTLYGHTERVLYLTASPDGSQIVTGSGDETIRFWSIFPSREKTAQDYLSKVSLDLR